MTTTAVLLKIESENGKPWWQSLGLPPPWKWGDDTSSAYVIQAKEADRPAGFGTTP